MSTGLISASTSEAVWVCPVDSTTMTITTSTLVAGSAGTPNAIVSLCTANPTHKLTLLRTQQNASEHAGLVNGLHRWLVAGGYMHGSWSADLTAETSASPDPRPAFFYTLDAVARTVTRNAAGVLATDLDALVTCFGITEAKARLEGRRVFTAEDDAAIAAWVASLYAVPGDRTKWGGVLKTARAEAFSI